jgi:hypothetical protein
MWFHLTVTTTIAKFLLLSSSSISFIFSFFLCICYYVTRKQRESASKRALRLNCRFQTLELSGTQKPTMLKKILETLKKKNSRKTRRPSQVLTEYYPESLPTIQYPHKQFPCIPLQHHPLMYFALKLSCDCCLRIFFLSLSLPERLVI